MFLKISFIFLLFFVNSAFSQYLQYKNCVTCPNGLSNSFDNSNGEFQYPYDVNYEYEAQETNYNYNNISSDYGRRESNSRWHNGVDFGLPGSGSNQNPEMGNKILAIESGQVISIRGSDYKYIKIASGNNVWGYGHIFYDGDPDPYWGMPMGNFILQTLDGSTEDYAIVYFNNGYFQYALSQYNNANITINGITYHTTNQVTQGMAIAPVGNSGGGYPDHVHLYSYVNQYNTSHSYPNYDCKDPLEILSYNSNVTISLYTNNLNTYPISYIRAESNMHNENVMNIDYMDLKIKKENEYNYNFIQGKLYDTKIHIGARKETDRYPAIGNPVWNTEFDISENSDDVRGSETVTGIEGKAYSYETINGTYTKLYYDNYYFASDNLEFRIHKDDVMGYGEVDLAENNEDARYPDGKYNLQLTAEDVKGNQLDPVTHDIIIDNFRPYVKKVVVQSIPVNPNYSVYTGEWVANNGTITCTPTGTRFAETGVDAYITVNTSEPLEETINLSFEVQNNNTSFNITPTFIEENAEKTEFLFIIPAAQTEGMDPSDPTKIQLIFTGTDLAGNQIEAFESSGTDQVQQNQIKIRQDENTWLPAPNPGEDRFHWFKYGCASSGNGKSINTEECLKADFYAEATEINVGETVHLHSLSTGNIIDYNYRIEGGIEYSPQFSNISDPSFTLLQEGYYEVKLTVSNDDASHTVYKEHYIKVNDPNSENEPLPEFTAYPLTVFVGEQVQFTDLSLNNPTYWQWEWPVGQVFSTEQNPTFSFSQSGPESIVLRVSNDGVNWNYMWKHNYITVVNANQSSISCYVENSTSTNQAFGFDIEIINAAYNPSVLYTYKINYGDGNTHSSVATSQLAYYNTHVYTSAGQKTYTIIVTNQNGEEVGSRIGTIEVVDLSSPIMAQIVMSNPNPVMGEMVTFSANTNAIGQADYAWTVLDSDGNTTDYVQDVTTFDKAFNSGEYTINLVVSADETSRAPGEDSKTFFIVEPNNCIRVKINKECIIANRNHTFTAEVDDIPLSCKAYDIHDNRLDYVTDIRWTLVKGYNPSTYYPAHYSIIDDNSYSQTFYIGNTVNDYRIIVEVWNRYAHPLIEYYDVLDIINEDLTHSSINKYNYDYYDRKTYRFQPGGSLNNSIKYISYDSNQFPAAYYHNRTFDENIIKTVDGNYIHSGDKAYYKASRYIELRDGFTAEAGSDFTATVDVDCGQGFYFYPFVLTYSSNNKNSKKSTGIEMLLFPNPTQSDFTVIIKSEENSDNIKGKIIIYDIYGRIIEETNNITSVNNYNIADKPANIYFVKYIYDETIIVKKLILTK